jgi:tagatose-1,6-bisphosphate aldolase non-catalytic subunit AgaZ/GatZ
VVDAALVTAQRLRSVLLFAATLNQVDRDGGYTGWTPASFVADVTRARARLGNTVPVAVCLDHGGPWLKDEHTRHHLAFAETLAEVQRSVAACLDAGYDLLHIDPTVDRGLAPGVTVPLDTVVSRTVGLVGYAEGYRRAHGLPPVAYEVGTEEVHGGIADPDTFAEFLAELRSGLTRAGLGGAWPYFVVGNVGTDLHTSWFDRDTAARLASIAARYGCYVKGHYTDSVTNPEDYPTAGMGGANVGPELTEAEHDALVELEDLESASGLPGSGIGVALEEAVVASSRWEKWRQPAEVGVPFAELPAPRRRWLVRTGCRYIWTEGRVMEARERLRRNLASQRIDAEAWIRERVGRVVERYIRAFGLVGSADVLAGESEGQFPWPRRPS